MPFIALPLESIDGFDSFRFMMIVERLSCQFGGARGTCDGESRACPRSSARRSAGAARTLAVAMSSDTVVRSKSYMYEIRSMCYLGQSEAFHMIIHYGVSVLVSPHPCYCYRDAGVLHPYVSLAYYVSNYYQLFGIRTMMIQVGLLLLSRIRTKKKRLDDFTSSSRLLHRDCRKKRLAIHAHRRLAPLAHEHPRAMPLPTFLKAHAQRLTVISIDQLAFRPLYAYVYTPLFGDFLTFVPSLAW